MSLEFREIILPKLASLIEDQMKPRCPDSIRIVLEGRGPVVGVDDMTGLLVEVSHPVGKLAA